MLESLFTWLLLPMGAVLGWTLARRDTPAEGAPATEPGQAPGGIAAPVATDAVAALTQIPHMDDGTAEMYLVIGNQFRRLGEVERAIGVHEALLARKEISAGLRQRAHFELAQDYLRAGLVDRAQVLFEELVQQGIQVPEALEQIVAIYEQGRDWQHAIEAAQRLQGAKGESRHGVIAQYWCELAEEQRREKNLEAAREHVKQALSADKTSVRAHLLQGALHMAGEDYAAAIKDYRRVFDLDARFLSEVLTPLMQCHEKTGDAAGYLRFLADAKEMSPSALPVVAEARLMKEEGMDAMPHLASGLEARPSRTVLVEFLEVMEKRPEIIAAGLDKPAASLRGALRRLIDTSPRYQCGRCGFSTRQMFWQCPTCKQWNTLAPLEDILKPAAQ